MQFFEGKDQFIWARGVVEDRFDPLFLGRCKVRYFGWHTEDKLKLPTKDLPWSHPLSQLDPGRSHVVGPKEQDWILAFFFDGMQVQFPVMVGVLPGYPERAANPSIGFNDPRTGLLNGHQVPREPFWTQQFDDGSGSDWEEISPKSGYPDVRYLKEAETNRYERAEFIDKTIIPLKKINVKIGQTDVPTAIHPAGTGTDTHSERDRWTEVETSFDAKYPYNHVYFSESGHIIEIDDTPNAERLHRYHRTGSFEEIHPQGLRVTKIVDDEYHIILKSKFEHIEHSKHTTIDKGFGTYVNKDQEDWCYDLTVGPGGNMNFTTEDGKLNLYINGDVNLYTSKNIFCKVDKSIYATVDENVHLHVKQNTNIQVDGDVNLSVVGNTNAKIDGDTNLTVGGDVNAKIDGDTNLKIAGNLTSFIGGNKSEYVNGDSIQVVNGQSILVSNSINNISATEIQNYANNTIGNTAATIGNNASNINHTAAIIDNIGISNIKGPINVSGTHVGPTPSGSPATITSTDFPAFGPSTPVIDEPIDPIYPESPIDADDAKESVQIPDQKSEAIDTKKDFYDYTKPSEPNYAFEPSEKIKK